MRDITQLLKKNNPITDLTKEEIIQLLLLTDASLLFNCADRVRKQYVGNEVYLRALIEFSNYCKNDCMYCGIRKSNLSAKRYRLTPNEIIETAKKAASYGYKTLVLQSGEDLWFSTEKLCDIISNIKKFGLTITLSIGEKTFQEYQAYKQAGADRYLLRIETTNQKLYEDLDPNMSWKNRKRCLLDLKKLGYEVGSGSLVGLPNQTVEDLANDLLFFKEINVDMAGIGPFIPHPQTPLATFKPSNNFELSLKMMAIMRLLLPDINIPATTAMETLNPNGRIIALKSGANVVMPNTTDTTYRKFYELYPGKICTGDNAEKCRYCVQSKIESIGRTVKFSHGFHGEYLKKTHK